MRLREYPRWLQGVMAAGISAALLAFALALPAPACWSATDDVALSSDDGIPPLVQLVDDALAVLPSLHVVHVPSVVKVLLPSVDRQMPSQPLRSCSNCRAPPVA